MLKFGKFFWRIWKVKFSASNLNLCPLNQLAQVTQVTTMEVTKMNHRSSHRRCSVKKGVLRNFANFTGKHLCQSLFFNKAEGLRPASLLKKRLWHRCFPVNVAKFLRTPFLQNTSGRLHLEPETQHNRLNSE